MAFSLEDALGLFFNNTGGRGVWYGGTGMSYGPVTVTPTGGIYPGGTYGSGSTYPDDEDGGGGPGGDLGSVTVVPVGINQLDPELIDEEGLYNGYVVLEQIQTSTGYYYMDANGNLFMKGHGTGLVKLTSDMAPVLDASFLADGNFETITTDTTTYYIMPNGAVYEADGSGE
jgi:hypothetical protein